jgi:alpha-tubulin suppressor-like RCC1 family protein
LLIGAKSCINSNKNTKTGSSSNDTFQINAPSNLNAIVISSSQINLSWSANSNNEDGFEIERSTDGVNYALISTLNANTTSYSDNGLIFGKSHYYRVRAFNTIGDKSLYSNEAKAVITGSVVCNKISAGENYTMALSDSGIIWAWGANNRDQWGSTEKYQLGTGDAYNRDYPYQITTDTDWLIVKAGYSSSMACRTDRTLWVWGNNSYGQLGIGDIISRVTPNLIREDFFTYPFGNVSEIAIGWQHAIMLKNDRTIWGCGLNFYGQIGTGDTSETYYPYPAVGSDSDWSGIAVGSSHSLAIKTNGTIWSWGRNTWGQLGLGYSLPYTIGVTAPMRIGNDTDWRFISSGIDHGIGIKIDNTLWDWGINNFGQLGLGDNEVRYTPSKVGSGSNWNSATGGGSHTIALKTDGSLYAWGYNNYGQLGLGNVSNRLTPTQVGTDKDWSFISAGNSHTVAIKTDKIIWAWGKNIYGQLGNGAVINSTVPSLVVFGIPSTPRYLVAEKVSNSQINLSWAEVSNNEEGFEIERKISISGTWELLAKVNQDIGYYSDTEVVLGNIYYYRIRAYNAIGNSSYSNEVVISMSDHLISSVAAGENHTVVLRINGTIWAWGQNDKGQLGIGDTNNRDTPNQLGSEIDWVYISAGQSHSIARKSNGTIWSWGYNSYGQLGLGDSGVGTNRSTPTQIGSDSDWLIISSKSSHNLALKNNGTLWSWGPNQSGILGLGDNTRRMTPSQIGTNTVWVPVIAVGGAHSIACQSNGTLWSWGRNERGQLGLGDIDNRNTPTQISIETDWAKITAGGVHTMGCKNNGTIWVWGGNNFSLLGLGDNIDRDTPSQLGTDSDWAAIVSGSQYNIALKNDFTLWSWGYNDYGQLGIDSIIIAQITPVKVGSDIDWIKVIIAGYYHTLAMKNNGSFWSWGKNDYGQLGLGDTINRITPALIGE